MAWVVAWWDLEGVGRVGCVLVGLMGSGGKRLCGESQQSAAGCLEDLGVWGRKPSCSLVSGTTGRVLGLLWVWWDVE